MQIDQWLQPRCVLGNTFEGVTEHSSRLQPLINLHAPVTYSLHVQLLWYRCTTTFIAFIALIALQCLCISDYSTDQWNNPINATEIKSIYSHDSISRYCQFYITLHCIALHCIAMHCITLHHITLNYITSHNVTLRYVTLRHVTSRHVTSRHVTSRPITSHHHHITSHHITSHHITSHHITLHYITLHYITLHYITSHYRHKNARKQATRHVWRPMYSNVDNKCNFWLIEPSLLQFKSYTI